MDNSTLKSEPNDDTAAKFEPPAAITREKFAFLIGREPKQDELERCNCPLAGRSQHENCGWDEYANRPVFDLPLIRQGLSIGIPSFSWADPKIKRLEQAVMRLCDVVERVESRALGFGGLANPARVDLMLIKQLVRGELDGAVGDREGGASRSELA